MDFPGAVVVIHHARGSTELPFILEWGLNVRGRPVTNEYNLLSSGTVHVGPPDHHVFVNPDRTLGLSAAAPAYPWRSSADWLFESAAAVFGQCGIAVVLSGRL